MDFNQTLNEVMWETGLTALKPKQCEAINVILSGRDIFVVVPTGYGKSIIYAVTKLV